MKINSKIAQEIYIACHTGSPGTARALAEHYNISVATVSRIANGQRWEHATKDIELTEEETHAAQFFAWSLLNQPEVVEAWKASQ